MSSNRVGGPNAPEPGGKGQERLQSQQHRRIEKVEKVREVDEVENEQTRKKFRQFMDEEEPASPRMPSPFETDFYYASDGSSSAEPSIGDILSSPSSLQDMEETAIPSAPYAPAPDVHAAPPPAANDRTGLPRSDAFWHSVDEPPDQPLKKAPLQETSRSSASARAAAGAKGKKGTETPHGKKPFEGVVPLPTESPFGSPGKLPAKEKKMQEKELEKEIFSPFAAPKKGSEKEQVIAPLHVGKKGKGAVRGKEEKEKGPVSPFAIPEKTKGENDEKPAAPLHVREKGAQAAPLHPGEREGGRAAPLHPDEREGGRGREKGKRFVEIASPSLISLPANIIPMAQQAAMQATPYLSARVMALFYQMVGTIAMIVSQGVSRTEITLDSPAFSSSKFFGAKITIEKYATAPDALNIRLTGSDAAVKAFNQDIPNLYAAFQNGNFQFRIGRIDAVYTLERPVLRRKESGEGKGDFGGDFEDRRK